MVIGNNKNREYYNNFEMGCAVAIARYKKGAVFIGDGNKLHPRNSLL